MKRTVVIGASRRQFLPAKVCEWSVRSHTSGDLEILHTYDRTIGTSEMLRRNNKSGFSYVRFAVPEMTGYQGRALYLDSDMIVFKDVERLFSLPMGEAAILRPKNQTAVLLYDCERLTHWRSTEFLRRLERGDYRYREMMETLYEPRVKVGIPPEWNQLDSFSPTFTALLHYTDQPRQPWSFARHPLANIWFDRMREAMRAGIISLAEVEAEVKQSHVGEWVLKEALAGVPHA